MIIKLTDANVDECGTNISTLLEIPSKNFGPVIENEITHKISDCVNKFIESINMNKDDDSYYETDDVLNAVDAFLDSEELEHRWLTEETEIVF